MASNPKSFSTTLHWLSSGDCRMDATYYNDEKIASRRVVEDSGFELKSLGDPEVTREIFNLPRFKRIYTKDPMLGYPYLSAYEAFMFRPNSERWIARDKAPDFKERYFLKEGWALVYCSGMNVGRTIMATRRLEKFFLTHDLIRIVPTMPGGYLNAFLASKIGKALMVGQKYGAAIPHLEPVHLASISIPIIPVSFQLYIHENMTLANRMRDEANDLLDNANILLHNELGLEYFDKSKVKYLDDSIKAFAINVSELADRFDASYHLPLSKTLMEELDKGNYPIVRLRDKVETIFIPNRFKRIYVAQEYGRPFLQPSHLPTVKPFDLKYISLQSNSRDSKVCTLHDGWVVITRSGTIGRVLYVSNHLDGWVSSDDLIRVVTDNRELNTGYLTAFLMTPYGYLQLIREVYGSVVDHLENEHVGSMWIPDAPIQLQNEIGKLVVRAFEMKEEANQLEDKTINFLEDIIKRGASRINEYESVS